MKTLNRQASHSVENNCDSVTETLLIRAMQLADLDEVLRIERGSYQLPWDEQIFRDCINVGYHCLVLEKSPGISGYVIFTCAAEESHILNLCIDPIQRKNGFAQALLAQAMSVVIVGGAKTMFLEVRESNAQAIHLYEKAGFLETGRRVNYYRTVDEAGTKSTTNREDALVMARDLGR